MSSGPEHWHCRIGRVKRRDNVYAFPGIMDMELPVRAQPDPDTIRLARALLDEAESGKCQGLAVGWLDQTGATFSSWAGAGRFPVNYLIGSLVYTAMELAIDSSKHRVFEPFGGDK